MRSLDELRNFDKKYAKIISLGVSICLDVISIKSLDLYTGKR
jgi:hypothetical protein